MFCLLSVFTHLAVSACWWNLQTWGSSQEVSRKHRSPWSPRGQSWRRDTQRERNIRTQKTYVLTRWYENRDRDRERESVCCVGSYGGRVTLECILYGCLYLWSETEALSSAGRWGRPGPLLWSSLPKDLWQSVLWSDQKHLFGLSSCFYFAQCGSYLFISRQSSMLRLSTLILIDRKTETLKDGALRSRQVERVPHVWRQQGGFGSSLWLFATRLPIKTQNKRGLGKSSDTVLNYFILFFILLQFVSLFCYPCLY